MKALLEIRPSSTGYLIMFTVDGMITTVYCFSMVLSASRKKAVCFSLKADATAIYADTSQNLTRVADF